MLQNIHLSAVNVKKKDVQYFDILDSDMVIVQILHRFIFHFNMDFFYILIFSQYFILFS